MPLSRAGGHAAPVTSFHDTRHNPDSRHPAVCRSICFDSQDVYSAQKVALCEEEQRTLFAGGREPEKQEAS